jgi:small subunit ribosomal protein S3e
VNKKRKFVADGVLFAEVNELLARELKDQDAGYAGVEIRNAPMRTEIIIRASRPQGAYAGAREQRGRAAVERAVCTRPPLCAAACLAAS